MIRVIMLVLLMVELTGCASLPISSLAALLPASSGMNLKVVIIDNSHNECKCGTKPCGGGK